MKTRNINQTLIEMVSTNFKFISEEYFKLYLPVNHLGKSRGRRCRVSYLMLLVILLVCE